MQYHERFGNIFCADRFWPSYIREFHCYQQTQLENCSAICDAFLKQRSSLVQCLQRNLTNINCNFLHHALLRSPPLSTKLFSLQQISDGIIVGQFEKSGKSNIWHWVTTAGQSLDLENLHEVKSWLFPYYMIPSSIILSGCFKSSWHFASHFWNTVLVAFLPAELVWIRRSLWAGKVVFPQFSKARSARKKRR